MCRSNIKRFKVIIAVLSALIGINCSSLTLQRNMTTPSWIAHHPISRTHFIGIGSAKIDDNLYAVQTLARKRALQDIAEQIQVSIVSDVHMVAKCQIINSNASTDNSYQEKIAAFSQAVVSNWEEVATFHTSNGYFWSKIVLSKKHYYEQVNKKVTNAIESLCDIIRYAQKGTALFRIQELHKGYAIIDAFFGTPLQGRINGRTVNMHNELNRHMRRLLESIAIRPVTADVTYTAGESIPQTLGVYVYCNGAVDKSLPVVWSPSHTGVTVKAAPMHSDGLHPVYIASLPPSSGPVRITATPDLKMLTYDLIRRKFTLPSGSFTIRRQKASVYLDSHNPFCLSLAAKLADRSAIRLVYNKNDADFILSSVLTRHDTIILTNSIYQADANLAIMLFSTQGMQVLRYNQTIQTCDGISADRALDNTTRYALEVAVKQIEQVL